MPSFDQTAARINGAKTEEVIINRQDAMRGRLRTTTMTGEDLIINLPRGKAICEGDVFGPSMKGVYYKIHIEPESVIKVTLDKHSTNSTEDAIKLGYNLGNRHLEVLIEDNAAFVPVTLGEAKITKMLESMKLPIRFETVKKVISASSAGYHPGEEEE
jgi:urease accessory protein UreE